MHAQTAKLIASWDDARDVWTQNREQTMLQISGHLDVYSGTFPHSGMTLNGEAYELPTWAPHMAGTGYSSSPDDATLLGTPTSRMWKGAGPKGGATQIRNKARGLIEAQVMDIPLLKTPTSQLAVNGGSQHPDKRKAGGHGPTLADEVEHLLPTPRTSDKNGPGVHGTGGQDLRTVVAMHLLPTPTVVMNDGETTEGWLARRAKVKETSGNGNGMGMPLTIAAQLIQEPVLLPSPTASLGRAKAGGSHPDRRRATGHQVNLDDAMEWLGAPPLTGGLTSQPSAGGKPSSDDQLPGQLSLLDALEESD